MRTRVLFAALASVLVGVAGASASPLLETHWDQDNEYAMFAPHHWRIGCWSTALAQILYYHRLAPFGSNSYTCTNGTYVSADFDDYTFDWRKFVDRIDPGTPSASAQEVARYSYFTSVAIEKDFNTGDYMLSHSNRAEAIENHYDCQTFFYELGWWYKIEHLKITIAQEIDAGCPLMLHVRDKSRNYHAVVIDDYQFVGDMFQVHINMGREGSDDGYYDIAGTIGTFDDTGYRKVIAVHPPAAWPIPGDANYDGQVNEEDAAIVADDWGLSGMDRDHGDFSGDGIVSAADAAILAANWGRTAGEASGLPVPEPGTGMFVVTGLLGICVRPRRTAGFRRRLSGCS